MREVVDLFVFVAASLWIACSVTIYLRGRS
jgi:hypothetical protein